MGLATLGRCVWFWRFGSCFDATHAVLAGASDFDSGTDMAAGRHRSRAQCPVQDGFARLPHRLEFWFWLSPRLALLDRSGLSGRCGNLCLDDAPRSGCLAGRHGALLGCGGEPRHIGLDAWFAPPFPFCRASLGSGMVARASLYGLSLE